MTVNKQIRKALGSTYLVYDNCRANHFMIWCSRYSQQFALPLLPMVQNKALYDWYCTQWLVLVEEPFYVDHHEYIMAGVEDVGHFQDLFLQYTEVLLEKYPKALLDLIKEDYRAKSPYKIQATE